MIGKNPDKAKEIERIRKIAVSSKMNKLKTVKVDLCVKSSDGTVHLQPSQISVISKILKGHYWNG